MLRSRTCRGKRRYRSREQAGDAAKYRRRKGSGYLRVYSCERCKGYHLTGQRPTFYR